jgi:hypothetical protein
MITYSNVLKRGVQVLLSCGFLKLASLIKLNFIVGSQAAFFSGSSVAMPLIGAFGGSVITSCVAFIYAFKYFFFTPSLNFLAYHIPGLFAAGYWYTDHWLIRAFLPLACMVAFIAHPVGGAAYAYSFYWLLPVVLFVVKPQGIFWSALGSTFIAHAVGSVIWLYTVPMAPQAWLALIPVVAFERLLFATSMVLVHGVVTATMGYGKKIGAMVSFGVSFALAPLRK